MADTHARRYLQALFSVTPVSVAPLSQPASSSRILTDTLNSTSGTSAASTDGYSGARSPATRHATLSGRDAATVPSSDKASIVAGENQLTLQAEGTPSSSSGTSRAADATDTHVNEVLELLHDQHVSEDDKPDALRSLLERYNRESAHNIEDLDESVLAILHRHREDVKPTGQTFAAPTLPKSASLSRSSSFRRNLTPTSASNLALKRTGAMTPTRPISPSPLRADSPSIHLYRSREADAHSIHGSSAPSSPFSSPKMLNIGAIEFKPNVGATEFKPSLMSQRSSSKLATHSSEPRIERFRSASPMGGPAFESPTLWAFNSSPLGTPRIATASPSGSVHTGSYFASQQNATPTGGSAIPADPWASTANSSAVSTISNPGITHSASTASSESSYDEITFDPFAEQRQTSTGKAQILQDEDEDEFGLPTDVYGKTPGGSSPLTGLSDREYSAQQDDLDDIDDFRIMQFQNGQLMADELELIEPHYQQRPTFNEQYVPQSTAQYSQLPDPALAADDNDANSKAGPAGLGASTSSYIMTPFDVLCSVFAGSDVTPTDLEEALTTNGWDVDKSMDWIINHLQSLRSAITQPTGADTEGLSRLRLSSPSNLSKEDYAASSAASSRLTPRSASSSRPSIVSHDSFQRQLSARSRNTLGVQYDSRPTTPGGRSDRSGGDGYMSEKNGPSTRLCKYFLQGNCLRSDCRFSHDLSKAVCKFWLRGHCLKGEDRCEFLHSVPPHLAQDVAQLRAKAVQDREREKARMHDRNYPRENTESPVEEDFPTLAAASASMQARSLSGTLLSKDVPPPSSRWTGAVKNGRSRPAHVPINNRPSLPKHASASSGREAVRDHQLPFSQPRRSHRIALRPPTLLPTVSTGADVSRLYDQYRENFFEFGNSRNKCLVKASQCWKSGDGAGARRWSKEAQDWNKQIAREGASAAKRIIQARKYGLRGAVMSGQSRAGQADESNDRAYRGKECAGGLGICLGVAAVGDALGPEGSRLSASERTEVALDLHGLHPDEALEILEQFLTSLASENTMRGLAYVIVGQERHTGTADAARGTRKLRLADAVGTWLDEYEYSFWLTNGIYAIDPY